MAYKKRIAELAEKWLKGTITEDEKQEFNNWYNKEAATNPEWTRDNTNEDLKYRLYKKIQEGINAEGKGRTVGLPKEDSKKYFYRWVSVAAVVVIAAGLWLFQYKDKPREMPKQVGSANISLPPGRNAATLTLNDGAVIDLEVARDGEISIQGEASVRKEGGQVAYVSPIIQNNEIPRFNTIQTARGNHYKLVLSDSTKVWLNSESSLRFPAVFYNNERIVELTGEAYFEVAKNADMPFRVKVDSIEVEVLGTHFNLNAYNDEESIKTTLLEGAVKVKKGREIVALTPGEQAEIGHGGGASFTVRQVDTEKEMAWQAGFFEFDNTELPVIMRQISRWYDVDIEYEGNPGIIKFGGRISKNLDLGNILALLEANGVRFTLEGETLIVNTYK